VVLTAMAWTLLTTVFGVVLFPPATHVWAPLVSMGPALAAILAVAILGRLADNQIRRYGLPPARSDR
jgi:hypothetical protein